MITDGKKWDYLTVKKLSALFKEITSNYKGEFRCLNCFHSFRTENELKKHKNVCENHNYWYVEMPKEDNKKLKYYHGEKSMKVPFIIYADVQSLLEKMNTCHKNPKNSSTTKINTHTPSGYSLFIHCSFDTIKNKLEYYRVKNRMKYFCLDLRGHAIKIANYEKNDTINKRRKENTS